MDTNPTVLFVDDEPNILQGLRRMLHSARREWKMEFALGPEAALAVLRDRRVDVLVTDMRMPGMDGAELLARVRQCWPHVTRIVLSGHSDHEGALRSVNAAHQYLMKPCDPEVLKKTVSRALALRDFITSPELRTLVARLNHVPSLPDLYVEISSAIAREDTSVRDIAAIIERDIAFSTKLLQLVNSAFFGLPRPVASPGDAAVLLGIELIRSLVLGTRVFSAIGERNPLGNGIESLWQHSLRTAATARTLANYMRLDRRDADVAFLAGLVHDIGWLVLLENLPAELQRCDALVAAGGLTVSEAEERVFGTTHEAISASLVGMWGLPDNAVEAIAYMHRPSESPAQSVGPLTAVHVAEVLDHELHGDGKAAPVRIDANYIERLGLTSQLSEWRRNLRPGNLAGKT